MTKMSDDLGIFPYQADGVDRLFLARFELPKFGEDFQISKSAWRALALGGEAPPSEGDDPPGFIHFLAGFPIDTVEMLMIIGEYSSKAKEGEDSKVAVMLGDGRVTAPIPEFFVWPDAEKLLLNRTAILERAALFFADNLPGEPIPKKAHWWFRVELEEGISIVPGEFLALGVRMMPGEFWGHQKSSPFMYSGNWMDTVYLTSAVITSIIEPTDAIPFSRYMVQWRKNEFTVNPSDFAEYKVDDRVTILKDVSTEKKSQLWKDTDMETEGESWMICPISFYHEDQEE